MFIARALAILLIPVLLIGASVWTFRSTEVGNGEVLVAGTLISEDELELHISSCYLTSAEGSRRLVVELEAKNELSSWVDLDPAGFHLFLAREGGAGSLADRQTFLGPIRYSSTCDDAPYSTSLIPPGAVRSITLVFWGENMPRGNGWDDHVLSLEYYDPLAPLALSAPLSPTEE